jgi:hypothetical protein
MPINRRSRVVSVDFWRGIALATIFIDHVPGNVLEHYTQRNFGFSDAAEVFVLLAGVAAAFAYLRHFEAGERAHQTLRVWLRAFTLYRAHIVVLMICGAIVAYASQATEDTRIIEMMQFDQIAKDPVPSIIGIATLMFQPSSQNILPLYVALLSVAPLLILLVRRDPRLALAVSGTVYVAAQIFHLTLPSYPLPEAWYFNPLTWQFLFTLGLVAGASIVLDRPLRLPFERGLIVASILYVGVSAVVIAGGFVGTYDFSPLPQFLWEQDKTNLSLPRLTHIVALAFLVSRLPVETWIRDRALSKPLILLGQHSLPVFSLGIILSIVAQLLRVVYGGGVEFGIFLIFLGLALQIGLAWVLEWQKDGLSRKSSSADPVAARG